MKAVLLGGNGFIGGHLARALRDAGHAVVSYDRQPPADTPCWPGVEYRLGDLFQPDPVGLTDILHRADLVYHLAWRYLPTDSNRYPHRDVTENLVGTLRVLELCIQQGVGRFIFFSSGGTVYGPAQMLPISEAHPTEPRSSHAINKLAVEKYLAVFSQSQGLDYVILRPGNPFGPYQQRRGQGVIAAFFAQAAAGLPLEVWGDGGVVRDYFYVGDLAEAACLAGQTAHSRTIYNIGSGIGRTLADVIAAIERLLDRPLAVRYHPGRPVDVPVNVLDISKAQAGLGWSPKIAFEDGLRLTWSYMSDALCQRHIAKKPL